MIKKMWALIVNYGTHKEIESVSKVKETEIIMSACTSNTVVSEVKPVWVCDRDPFENVRAALLINEISDDKFRKIVADALKLDIKNFDEGAG